MQPQKYGVSVFHDIRALESLESTHLKLGYGACFDKYTGMNASELQHVIRYERYERLNKKDCIDRFAQDYLLGQKAVLVMTNTSLPSDVPLVYAGSGNHALDFTSSYATTGGCVAPCPAAMPAPCGTTWMTWPSKPTIGSRYNCWMISTDFTCGKEQTRSQKATLNAPRQRRPWRCSCRHSQWTIV